MVILIAEVYMSGVHSLAIDEVTARPDTWFVEATSIALGCATQALDYQYVAVKLPRTELPLELAVEGPNGC